MIKVTEGAATRIKKVLTERTREFAGLRVGLQDGGCSGYTYHLDFERSPEADDHVIEEHGVKVFVHPLHAPFVQGSVLVWKEGRFESGFELQNPNVKRTCGCGVSLEF